MTIGNVITFLKKLYRDETLKAKFSAARTDEEIEDLARSAGYDISAVDFFSVVNDLPGETRDLLLEELMGEDNGRRSYFCEGCDDRGSNFCIAICFWLRI